MTVVPEISDNKVDDPYYDSEDNISGCSLKSGDWNF